jgi:hypothetical protein
LATDQVGFLPISRNDSASKLSPKRPSSFITAEQQRAERRTELAGQINNGIAVQNLDNGRGRNDQWSMGLDDFELLTVIGRGSYAKVVQAEHK